MEAEKWIRRPWRVGMGGLRKYLAILVDDPDYSYPVPLLAPSRSHAILEKDKRAIMERVVDCHNRMLRGETGKAT